MLFKELKTGQKFKLINSKSIYIKIHLSEEVNEGWKGFGFYFNTVTIEEGTSAACVSYFIQDNTEVILPKNVIVFSIS